VKLLALKVENLPGFSDGLHSFANKDGCPRDVVVLRGDTSSARLETIAAVLEAVRSAEPHCRAWWAVRRGPEEARLSVRWRLSVGEAARAGSLRRTLTSEWCFGPGDELPREVRVEGVEGALSQHTRADLADYCHIDANRSPTWLGGPGADPLVEMLAGIARRDVAGTRVFCQEGVGIVGLHTPDTFATLNRAIAGILPALRLERVGCGRGGVPVACFRVGERVELGQLGNAERDAIHIAAAIHVARVRNGVVLVDRPELHVPRGAHVRWLNWLAGLAGSNQLFVAVAARADRTSAHNFATRSLRWP
jgi:hypothetical protein